MDTTMPHGNRRGIFSIMLASTLWGTVGVASQAIAQHTATNSLSLSFLRLFVAAPVLLLAGQRLLGKRMWSASRRDLGLMMLVGGLVAIDQTLYFAAIAQAGVAVATLITICAAPVLVTLLTAIIEWKRPDGFTMFSVVLGVVGTILLVQGSHTTALQSVSLVGIGLSLGAAAGYAGVILLGQFLASRCHPLQVTAVGFTTGAILLAIAAYFTGFIGAYSVEGWGLILYIGVIPTALGYGLFLLGMQTTSAPIASVLVLLEPLTATFLAWTLFGERLSSVGIAGAVMLLAVIYLLSTRKR